MNAVRAIFAGVLLLSAATSADVAPRPPVREAACAADRDCVLTTFDGCCGSCCPGQVRAMSSPDLKRQQDRCAVIDCARPSCPDVKCAAPEPTSAFRAVCRQGACQAERVNTVADCRADADCAIAYPSPVCRNPGPCGCCPGTEPVAVTAASLDGPPSREPRSAPAPAPANKGEVKFGLSEGGRDGPAPPNCSPCPGPRPATARCSVGKCMVAPVPVPIPRPRPPG